MNTPQVPAGASTGSPRIEGIDVPKVSAWIAAHTDITAPLTFKLIAGGRSNITFTVTDAAGRRFVLRRPLARTANPRSAWR